MTALPWILCAALALAALVLFQRARDSRKLARELEAENTRLREEKEMAVRFMSDMVDALGKGLTRADLFQRIAHAAVHCTHALSACVYELLPEGSLAGVAVEGLFPPQRPMAGLERGKSSSRAHMIEQVLRSEKIEAGAGIIGMVAKTRKTEIVKRGVDDPRVVNHGDEALALRSMVATPIVFGRRLIGVLAVANSSDGSSFTDIDRSLVESLAVQAGLAVHNNEVLAMQREKQQMDLDLTLARSVQMMLVPAIVPGVAGLEVDARYIPAQRVGGDLVDGVALPDGRLGLVVADVSGKGVAASILMAICRTHVRHALEQLPSPADVLRRVNHALAGDVREGMFITALVAVIDPPANTITFARAGHEAPLLGRNRSDGFRTELVECEGMALGMVGAETFDAAISDCTVPFLVGDIAVLYTDGLTEAPNADDKEFSAARLMDALSSLRGSCCADLNTGILETVERFCGSVPQRDDLTLVTIRRV